MDRPALLANENVPAPLVRQLRERGLTVHSVSDLMPMASDRAVLLHAHHHGLWVLTFMENDLGLLDTQEHKFVGFESPRPSGGA